jgi:transmembrane sensor
MTSHDKAKSILKKYLQGKCSDSEKEIVEAWYRDHVDQPLPELRAVEDQETGDRILAELRRRLRLGGQAPVVRMPSRRRWAGYAAACVLFLGLGTGVWWMSRQRHGDGQAGQAVVLQQANDIGPGGNKAVLTLANGSKIILDSAAAGLIARQGASSIVQRSSGRLEYQSSAHNNSGTSSDDIYNSLSTPAGGQYQLVLPDGTKVWLNALTTIRYPSSFTGADRVVQVDGEAYFEVAKDEGRPFRVTARDISVEVLGTAFNINCYNDEPSIRTSLLQGAVRLVKGNARLALRPGEQAQTVDHGVPELVPDADVEKAIAWKNGSFSFDNDNIQSIMRQLAKWYGVDIRYQGEPTHTIFGGTMRRTLSLQQVLSALSKYDVHFQLEGRTLVVMP